MIRIQNAIDTLDRSLVFVENEAERERLTNRLGQIEPNALRFLAAVFQLPSATNDDEKPDSNHICRSLSRLVALVDNENGKLKPLVREEIAPIMATLDSLKDVAVRERCLYTVYRLFSGGDPDVATTFVDRLEDLSGGPVLLGELSLEDALLYRKLYVLVVCLYSKVMSADRLSFILQDQFVLLALLMDIELLPVLADHIRSSSIVNIRRDISLDFASSMMINRLALGKDVVGRNVALADWVDKARAVLTNGDPEKATDRVLEWLHTNSDVLANDDYIQSIIKRFVLTYVALVSGYCILEYHGEPEFKALFTALEKAEENIPAAPPNVENPVLPTFPVDVRQHRADFVHWIGKENTRTSLLAWLTSFVSEKEAWFALTKLFREIFISPLNAEQVNALADLDAFLKSNGYGDTADLVYFNEKNSIFEWN